MSRRIRVITSTLLVCFVLCLSMVAFTGTASAATSHQAAPAAVAGPHVNNVPNKVYPDINGCFDWTVYGKGWLPGDIVGLTLEDGTFLGYGFADATGHFATSVSVCGYSPGTHRVSGVSFYTIVAATDRVIFL